MLNEWYDEHAECRYEISRLKQRLKAADRLAFEVARHVEQGIIGSRSGAGDALLDYLQIGAGPEYPQSVPEWVEQHKATLDES